MFDAGITSPEAFTHPIHLWPLNKKGNVARVNVKQTKSRFNEGYTFLGPNDIKLTIHDIPKGANVVLHCKAGSRIFL